MNLWVEKVAVVAEEEGSSETVSRGADGSRVVERGRVILTSE